MDLNMSRLWIPLYLVFISFCNQSSMFVISQPCNYIPAYPSVSWTNSLSSPYSIFLTGGSQVNVILFNSASSNQVFGCGFFCDGDCQSYIFSVFILYTMNQFGFYGIDPKIPPQVVWSANRNNPVKINATMKLTTSGLVLEDSDATSIWSLTNTGDQKSVGGLILTDMGNLQLVDKKNVTIWQSFDHPTDMLRVGQKLVAGKRLTSSPNRTETKGAGGGNLYSLSVTNQGLFASIESTPPQVYYQFICNGTNESKGPSYVTYENQTLGFHSPSSNTSNPDRVIRIITLASGSSRLSGQYINLDSDGHLRVIPNSYETGNGFYAYQYSYETGNGFYAYQYSNETGTNELLDLDSCAYPMVCGKYGVCSNSRCSCPENANGTTYFKHLNYKEPEKGCYEVTPLSCKASQYHSFVELEDISYFSSFTADLVDIDSESCKRACLKNCSCKAAIFHYGLNPSEGKCYLPAEIFSLMNNDKNSAGYSSITYIKVQNKVPRKKKKSIPVAVIASLGTFVFGFFSIVVLVILFCKKQDDDDDEESDIDDQVPGMPKRFSYEDMKSITHNFNKQLGAGGFGTVFEGVLIDGTKVAVKRLDGFGQIKKSFLAEVATIGSIHHVNLVRIIGFCAEKSHRLLAYEYMSNGSLDKWIFHKTYELLLSWKQRKKIIFDIAKGLNYLHEDCRHKILHLDIKPENILLDQDFNGKVSDFGLSKLIDRNQSQVVTTMRGTPGYLAPEWLSSMITEKVDVYSFGIVTMEILCGRRNIDRSQPEEAMHLLHMFKKKYEVNQISGLIDKCCEDMQANEAEVMKMMKVAAWCLQSDFANRPSMSMVVKVLEGASDIEYKLGLDYNFSNAPLPDRDASLVLPSLLSGAR